MAEKARKLAQRLLAQLEHDRDDGGLLRIDDYARGIQDDPYMPDGASEEYALLAQRAKTNVIEFVVRSSSQGMYVDQFRPGNESDEERGETADDAESRLGSEGWDHWQRSRLDARQAAVYRGALTFGHSFVLTEKVRGKVRSRGLSALRTVAFFEDPANDEVPYAVLHVTKFAEGDGDDAERGRATMWVGRDRFKVSFVTMTDKESVRVGASQRHGASEVPITRFAAAVDLEGRTTGVVEPMIPMQDRLNQTIFDLLVVQSYASFKVRTVSGMAPPLKRHGVDTEGAVTTDPEKIVDYEVTLDSQGKPIPEDVNLNAKRFFWAEDENVKFNSLDETPLDGFIEAIKLGFQHMAALSQTPPHHLLGQIANLSADALRAAETALLRKIDEFKSIFGESWERVFRIAAELGDTEGQDDFHGEVIWRDFGNVALSQTVDGLAKLHSELGVPARGLWKRVPQVTGTELAEWEEMAAKERPAVALSQAVGTANSRPSYGAARKRVTAEDPVEVDAA